MKKYIDRKTLSERWGMNPKQIARWDEKGQNIVKSYKINGNIRYLLSEVEKAEEDSVWHRPLSASR